MTSRVTSILVPDTLSTYYLELATLCMDSPSIVSPIYHQQNLRTSHTPNSRQTAAKFNLILTRLDSYNRKLSQL